MYDSLVVHYHRVKNIKLHCMIFPLIQKVNSLSIFAKYLVLFGLMYNLEPFSNEHGNVLILSLKIVLSCNTDEKKCSIMFYNHISYTQIFWQLKYFECRLSFYIFTQNYFRDCVPDNKIERTCT